jgi:hypothetical protein
MVRAEIAHRRDIDASLGELVGISLALVAQHIVFGGDDERRRHASELIERGVQRRDVRVSAFRLVRQIGVPEPLMASLVSHGPFANSL